MENLKLVHVINKDKKYKDKSGKEHTEEHYYISFNNTYIAIRPSFADGYQKLNLLAERIVNGK